MGHTYSFLSLSRHCTRHAHNIHLIYCHRLSPTDIIPYTYTAGVHYTVSKKDQKVELTPAGFKFAEQIVGKGLFDLADPWAFYIINALKAKEVSSE
jgi:preprotein translocase subunit SecA